MEQIQSLETADIQPLSPSVPVPPTLRDGECYHVFISYSSTDHQWTHCLIEQLEACGLQVCYHERDFLPGRTVLENMSDCIQESQKVLLVLSPEFVRSRWCLLEANMSLFRDCLERKPIVPVLLEPGVSVPLHLCHLTYLEANDPDFKNKLLKVLCTPNQQLQGSTVLPFHPPSIYNGKALQPLIAVNEERLSKWDCGQFSDMEVPDQLRLIIEDQEKYRKAVRMINSVSENKVLPRWATVMMVLAALIMFSSLVALSTYMVFMFSALKIHGNKTLWVLICSLYCLAFGMLIQISLLKVDQGKCIVREMQKALGQANIILSEEKVLMGSQSNSKIYLVYVSLDRCKHEFAETFSDQVCPDEMYQRALLYFSSGYACCLAKTLPLSPAKLHRSPGGRGVFLSVCVPAAECGPMEVAVSTCVT
ncbi:Toll-like receptor 2 type-1 [Dissostichus eleginoides]|uniref:Toll-like receptor 2 type-1 n=1 Tax=Dissostichus eleginoides TaxID=100907 RepID=A0AAD9BUS6_DISEL|nr:Toll-like receptor 2 type-1 [Dissostichus eleginoides]